MSQRSTDGAHPCVAIDVSHSALVGRTSRTPRGIDRVEVAYARHFLNDWPGECVPVLPTPFGARFLERRRGVEGIEVLRDHWREGVDPEQDPFLRETRTALSDQRGAVLGVGGEAGWFRRTDTARRLIAKVGFSPGRSMRGQLPRDAVYLSVGHHGVASTKHLSWLEGRPDVSAVFMVHDAIPLEHPEYVSAHGWDFHHRVMENTARFATAIITNSRTSNDSLLDVLETLGRSNIPAHVETLPVGPEFLTPAIADEELAAACYFVVGGPIEPRKNHMLLVRVWTELVRRHGKAAPRLVMAGYRGMRPGPVEMAVTRGPAKNHIVLVSGLSTPALRRIVAGARSLLMPSFAEGFGLPIVEALAQGVPVVASDIPAHREAGAGGEVTFLHPSDRNGWVDAVEAAMNGAPPHARHRARAYVPKSWDQYFAGVEGFLRSLPRADRPSNGK